MYGTPLPACPMCSAAGANKALKFVSFPTQVLAKASKVIPLTADGAVVSTGAAMSTGNI